MPTSIVAPVKQVREYPLPASTQTHEIVAVPGSNLVLVSQQTNSVLVKVLLDPATGAPVRAVGHLIGAPWSGLHGLWASKAQPGKVWATLQFESKVLLLDPVAGDPDAPPVILQTYTLPVAARGPHCLIEDGQTLWVSAKDGGQIVRINTTIDSSASQPYTLYASERHPIFVAKQASTGLIFATEIPNSSIMWIDPDSGETGQIQIPPAMGSAPVGMIGGADGNVWFVLLGGSAGGTGTFGRINKDKSIDWFHLTGPWANAALVHLAWESPVDYPGRLPALILLASSSGSMAALNAVIRVTFNPTLAAVDTEAAAIMATASCMTHRVLATPLGWYVTEMMACQIAHVPANWVGSGLEAVDEGSDYFADFGMGARSPSVEYR